MTAALTMVGGAYAQSEPELASVPTHPLSSCKSNDPVSGSKKCWENWGAAPYASTENRLSNSKLDKFLTDAENCAGLPPEVAAMAKRDMQANPQGHGPTYYLTPGEHLDMMESRDGPMCDVTVGEIDLTHPGEVKAATAHAYPYMFKGVLWVILDPGACHNLSLYSQVIRLETHVDLQQSVIPDCVTIQIPTDNLPPDSVKYAIVLQLGGPHALAPSVCVLKGKPCHLCLFTQAEEDEDLDVNMRDIRATAIPAGSNFAWIEVSPEVLTGGPYSLLVCLHAWTKDGSIYPTTHSQLIRFEKMDPKRRRFGLHKFEFSNVPEGHRYTKANVSS